jgi:hypothetical protein
MGEGGSGRARTAPMIFQQHFIQFKKKGDH